jgi:hypothetical protein
MYPVSPMAGFITQSRRSGTFYQICVDAKVSASTYVFPAAFVLTCRSGNRRASFPFGSQQQATEVLRHDLPKFRLMGPDISAGLFYPSMRSHHL